MGLKEKGLTGTLLLTVFAICFGSSFILGYNIAVMNFSHGGEMRERNFAVVLRLAHAVWVIGGAIGAFCSGLLAEEFGRRNSLLLNHLIALVGAVISAVSSKYHLIVLLGRFILGLNCGVTTGVASMYLVEIAPTAYRGSIGACHQLGVTIGIFISYVISLSHLHWSWGIAIGEVPAIASIIILPFCPESPRFLLSNKRNEEAAKEAFEQLNTKNDVNTFITELKAEVEAAEGQLKFRFHQLFTKKDLRMAVATACLMQILQQFSGIDLVITYPSLMFEVAGVKHELLPYCVCGIGLFNVILTVISLPLLERAGRRTLLLWPTVLLAISLVILTFTLNLPWAFRSNETLRLVLSIVSVLFIFIYICGFALGLGPIPAMIVAEIFRQGPRAAAYSLSQGLQWLINLLLFNSILTAGGISFVLLLIVVVGCWVFFFLYMPETKNRTFDEIAQDLSSGKTVYGKKSQN